jgi:hypothetical protein
VNLSIFCAVMAGLVPAIHAFLGLTGRKKDVDARDKRGHDADETKEPERFTAS